MICIIDNCINEPTKSKFMEFHKAKRLTDEGKQKVALVDIDETICYYEDSNNRRYDLSIPIRANINKINRLYNEGWKIVYWTARGSVSKKDYTEYTQKQLEEWGCKFHELITGMSENPKPHFDLVIDDKAKRIEEVFEEDSWYPDSMI